MFQKQSRKCRDYGYAGVNEEGNGEDGEKVGAVTEDQRGISGG